MITSAAAAGAADRDIQRQSRHKSAAVMQRYIRPRQRLPRTTSRTPSGCDEQRLTGTGAKCLSAFWRSRFWFLLSSRSFWLSC